MDNKIIVSLVADEFAPIRDITIKRCEGKESEAELSAMLMYIKAMAVQKGQLKIGSIFIPVVLSSVMLEINLLTANRIQYFNITLVLL